MNFGAVAFSEAPFSAQQFELLAVTVTGATSTTAVGSVTITANANISVTGTALTSGAGSTTVFLNTPVDVTGVAITTSAGILNGIGWSAVSIGTAQSWSSVSKGSGQTWSDVDEVEKVA
tara:strand:- start:173 stop:529 length:357 start_codon:yes stop_codon:yes gene_type:complete